MFDSIVSQSDENASVFLNGRRHIGNVEHLAELDASIKRIRHSSKEHGRRITFRSGMFEAAEYVGEAFCLYMHMVKRIIVPRRKSSWVADALQYYHAGYLPFAAHQGYTAEGMGVSRYSIIRWTRTLIDCNLIARLDSVLGKRNGMDVYVDVYSLGHWYPVKRGKNEVAEYVFYAEEFRPELMTDERAIKRYRHTMGIKC